MNRIKTLLCAWLGCQPNYGGQIIWVKKSLPQTAQKPVQTPLLPLLRRVNVAQEVNIAGDSYQVPRAPVGATVLLTQTTDGWQYQVLREVPQSIFASLDPLRNHPDTDHAGCTHRHSGSLQTSKTHRAIKVDLSEPVPQAHQSNHSHHTFATSQDCAEPSICPWCGAEQ